MKNWNLVQAAGLVLVAASVFVMSIVEFVNLLKKRK